MIYNLAPKVVCIMYDIAMIGGDIRQFYMAELLTKRGYSVISCGLSHPHSPEICHQAESLKEAVSLSRTLVGPIPFSSNGRDITSMNSAWDFKIENFLMEITGRHMLFAGLIPKQVTEYCEEHQIPYLDFMKHDAVAIANGVATAEGAIMEAIHKSTINLHHSRCLLIGYGRCGKILAKKLLGMDAYVTVAARKDDALAEAMAQGCETCPIHALDQTLHQFDYIFNTAPSLVLPEKLLRLVSADCAIIDIASAPGGLDYKAAEKLHLNVSLFLGIPGKVAPKASADILVDFVLKNRNRYDRKKVCLCP